MKLSIKLINGVRSLFLHVYYYLVNSLSRGTIEYNERSVVSVSLTSYGKRINRVYLAIESIFAQEGVDVLSITLWLSSKDIEPDRLPRTLLRLKKRGLKIRFVDENIKSYKKIYYEYVERKVNKNAIIVTADDDVFYPQGWLEQLCNGFKNNEKVVTCFRGHYITLSSENCFNNYTDWTKSFESSKYGMSELKSLLPTGVGGVLYPIESLRGLDEGINLIVESCPNADDIWLKLLCLKNGYGSKCVSKNNIHFIPVLSFKMKGLELYNIFQGGNDLQFKQSLITLGLSIKDFKNDD